MPSYKIMIVDDEVLIRDLIRKRIDWTELGMEIVCEASNAHEALDLVEEFKPDIIITDICMPVMDGIEFSRIVIESHPYIKIVILTGHDEFEYAKRSIKVGISDFLLKPINGNEIKKVVLRLKERLEEEKSHSHEFEKLKRRLEENLPFLKEKFLNELIHKDLQLDQIKDALSYYNLNFDQKCEYYQIAIIEAEYSDLGEDIGEEQKIMLGMQCKDLVIQYFRADMSIYVFSENDKRVVILSNDASIDVVECCENIKIMLINRLKSFVNIGIGNKVRELKNLRYSYKEACEAFEYKIIAGRNQVVSYGELIFLAGEQGFSQHEGIDNLKFYIKAGLADKAETFIEEMFKDYGKLQGNTIDNIRLVALDAVSACLHVLFELGINTSVVWPDKLEPYNCILKADTLPDIKNYLKNFNVSMIASINCLNSKKVNVIVKQVKEYIENNIEDPEISPSGIAKAFFLNQSHLSRLFKQETGHTVVEFLTRIRLEKAMELLKSTDLKVYQIGERVGIPDPHYFSIVFKKFTGRSVNDYRKI